MFVLWASEDIKRVMYTRINANLMKMNIFGETTSQVFARFSSAAAFERLVAAIQSIN